MATKRFDTLHCAFTSLFTLAIPGTSYQRKTAAVRVTQATPAIQTIEISYAFGNSEKHAGSDVTSVDAAEAVPACDCELTERSHGFGARYHDFDCAIRRSGAATRDIWQRVGILVNRPAHGIRYASFVSHSITDVRYVAYLAAMAEEQGYDVSDSDVSPCYVPCVDYAPTTLSHTGVPIVPTHMQTRNTQANDATHITRARVNANFLMQFGATGDRPEQA